MSAPIVMTVLKYDRVNIQYKVIRQINCKQGAGVVAVLTNVYP